VLDGTMPLTCRTDAVTAMSERLSSMLEPFIRPSPPTTASLLYLRLLASPEAPRPPPRDSGKEFDGCLSEALAFLLAASRDAESPMGAAWRESGKLFDRMMRECKGNRYLRRQTRLPPSSVLYLTLTSLLAACHGSFGVLLQLLVDARADTRRLAGAAADAAAAVAAPVGSSGGQQQQQLAEALYRASGAAKLPSYEATRANFATVLQWAPSVSTLAGVALLDLCGGVVVAPSDAAGVGSASGSASPSGSGTASASGASSPSATATSSSTQSASAASSRTTFANLGPSPMAKLRPKPMASGTVRMSENKMAASSA
jgi:hypothetical protein